MKTVGVIVADLYDSYQQTLLKGVKQVCELKGIRLLTFVGGAIGGSAAYGFQRNSLYSLISENSVDGLLIISGSLSVTCGVEGLLHFINELPDLPMVSIGVKVPDVPSIIINNRQGIKQVMDHLIEVHKYKNIAFIKGPEANQEALDRFEAYRDSIENHGLKYNYKLVAPGTFSPGDGIKGINLIMDTRGEEFDALVCCDDYTAIEAIGALINRGYSVPKDVVVTGFDDLERSGSLSPALTTVSQPIFNIGSMSLNYLDDLMAQKAEKNDIVVPTALELRESCGCEIATKYPGVKNSQESSLETLLPPVTKGILEKNSVIFYKTNRLDFVGPLINRIAKSIVECEKANDISLIESEICNVFKESYNQGLRASFWRSTLEEFLMPFISGDYKNSQFISLLLKSALLKLYEEERRIIDFKRIDDRTLIQYINRLGDKLLLCRTDKELQKVLKDNLSMLKVNSLFVMRYIDGKEQSEVFFARNSENNSLQYSESFVTKDLIPSYCGTAHDLSYVIYPIIIDNHQIGYIMVELRDAPTIIYDFLAEKISYGFKNIRIMKQIGSYTEHLEKAVENRTKELKLANIQLQERSMKDQLTGLRNRRFLDEVIIPKAGNLVKKIRNQIKYGNRAITSENISFGIILVDLDHFKEVNDIYGHASGDSVIKELAKLFTYSIRQEDYVIRLGGEEFLIVLTDFNATFINVIVEKLRAAVEGHKFTMENGEVISKTCSLGAMAFPATDPDLIDFKTAIAIIDKCLYHAKENGRNSGYVIDIDSNQFTGCTSTGEYIINNFEKCIKTNKISLLNSKKS